MFSEKKKKKKVLYWHSYLLSSYLDVDWLVVILKVELRQPWKLHALEICCSFHLRTFYKRIHILVIWQISHKNDCSNRHVQKTMRFVRKLIPEAVKLG